MVIYLTFIIFSLNLILVKGLIIFNCYHAYSSFWYIHRGNALLPNVKLFPFSLKLYPIDYTDILEALHHQQPQYAWFCNVKIKAIVGYTYIWISYHGLIQEGLYWENLVKDCLKEYTQTQNHLDKGMNKVRYQTCFLYCWKSVSI